MNIIIVPYPKLTLMLSEHSPQYMGMKFYNQLSQEIKFTDEGNLKLDLGIFCWIISLLLST